MAKPTQNKETKPLEDTKIGQGANKPQFDTNQLIIINTIVLIIFFILLTVIGNLRVKSLVQDEIKNIKPADEIALEEGEENPADEQGVLLDLGDFILNLADTASKRYLKVNVAIELTRTEEEVKAAEAPQEASGGHGHAAPAADPAAAIVAEMEQYKPAIRDAVITVLSGKTADELSSVTGKEIAKEEIQDLVSSIFNGTREVLRVNFAQFIIQ